MPTTIDTAFLDTMPPNVAVQFFDRVTATPDAEAFRFPVARRGSPSPGSRPATRSRRSPQA